MTVVFLANAGLIALANRSLDDALKRAHQNERAQIKINRELEAVRASLEHQVIQRTQDLETRSSYLLSTTEISRTVASILDIELLLQQTVNLMQEKFNLYYVGLFLVDSKDEWADLQAGTGKAGQAMLNRSHRIRVGNGMIGWSIANSRPRVAQEINADDMHLATPELPETRSEASIPLRSRGNVLGAISVQSTRPDAFSEMEIAIFQTLADQVAISIDNARLLEESQISLKAMQRAYREKSRDDWTQLLETETQLSFSYDHHKVMSIENEWRPEMEQAARTGHIVQSLDDGVANLFIPIIVRDHVVGVLNPTRPQEQGWSEDEISLLQSLAEQLGLAIDSARLYQEADRRATRERLTGEIAAKVRASNDPQTIMQTAVRELRRALRADQAQVLVRNTRLTKPGEVIPVKTTFNAGEGDNGHGRTVEEE